MRIKRALISVSDKTGLIPLAKELARLRVEIFSTGGTLALLHKEKIKAKSISELTGFPEILDGRVKTLHPKVHGGLLFLRSKAAHKREAKKQGILPIDLVVVNLYPFAKTIQKSGTTLKEAIEQIDIGGPSMLRSASKNFESVTVVSDPNDYSAVISELKKLKGATSPQFRKELALKAFRHTAAYDQQIAQYLGVRFETKEELPKTFAVAYERAAVLRYGENPHQRAALYKPVGGSGKFHFEQLQGKELSYNNILDFEAAVDILREFKEPAACVVKHNNPSGVSTHSDISVALEQAIDCDPLSAFGGIVGLNQNCDERAAGLVFAKLPFFEVILAPHFTSGALEILKSRKNLRIIQISGVNEPAGYQLRFAKSGLLLQDEDAPIRENELKKKLKWVTHEKLKGREIDDLIFAWKCAKVVKSNAIALTQGKRTVGIGGGQMSRVDSVKIACAKASGKTRGAFLASDGFFPMPDNIEVAHAHGIRAIIQPGGSIKDQEVIDAANHAKIAMAFTGERHFKH
ncbi:MAG TPA: bifunctional phosphoribosylaminoimidazolecarboxamide formyltransferase/IMP cyclohydrolase [Candidatus Omnitrophota bacterium]|nr:bifunctional phosphoribosylaminoimidazolecarboxamide formyltransferase/IMP cyclohydrolase [Candidatus Omnitrophota bacterium]